jgi:hypothetical protein
MFYHPVSGLVVKNFIPHWTYPYYHSINGLVVEKKYKCKEKKPKREE